MCYHVAECRGPGNNINGRLNGLGKKCHCCNYCLFESCNKKKRKKKTVKLIMTVCHLIKCNVRYISQCAVYIALNFVCSWYCKLWRILLTFFVKVQLLPYNGFLHLLSGPNSLISFCVISLSDSHNDLRVHQYIHTLCLACMFLSSTRGNLGPPSVDAV